jgi:urease accessory protein
MMTLWVGAAPKIMARLILLPLTTACLALATSPALAHTGSVTGGFVGGLAHPFFGPDHLGAMVAVGLWGAFLGPPAMFILPVVFPLVMAFGGVLAIAGMPLPGVEIGIAVSAAVLGMMVALAARPPLWIAAILVGAFAIFHGHAHGAELPVGADALAFSAGFVMATGLLHLAGIAFGLLARWPAGRIAVRGAGGVIAVAGLLFLGRLV